MKKKGKKLDFISFIKRDGSGTIPIGTEWDTTKEYPKIDEVSYLNDEVFRVKLLSMEEETFIARGFNSFVVKLKK